MANKHLCGIKGWRRVNYAPVNAYLSTKTTLPFFFQPNQAPVASSAPVPVASSAPTTVPHSTTAPVTMQQSTATYPYAINSAVPHTAPSTSAHMPTIVHNPYGTSAPPVTAPPLPTAVHHPNSPHHLQPSSSSVRQSTIATGPYTFHQHQPQSNHQSTTAASRAASTGPYF